MSTGVDISISKPAIPTIKDTLIVLDKALPKIYESKTVDATIYKSTGEVIFSLKNVEAPVQWNQVSINIAAEKYFAKGENPETSVYTMVNRVASEIGSSAVLNKYIETDTQELFVDVLSRLLLGQYYCFNSPVWFNVGVHKNPRISACFILGIEDNMQSILENAKTEGMIYKYGSGSGVNYSPLRGRKERLSHGGVSSGVMSFVDIGDAVAGSIKSGGRTRRAAKMVILDVDHPDIEEFVSSKIKEEKKAKVLIDAGYSSEFDDEHGAYATIRFQNANHSVRVTDDFMNAVDKGSQWALIGRVPSTEPKMVEAKDLFHDIAAAAWSCGDPGLQFDTTINRFNTLWATARINGSNPCVVGRTLIATGDGYKRIDSLVGRTLTVLGGDGHFHRVDKVFKTGTKRVFRLTTRAGYSLDLTEDHPVFTTNRGDIPAALLNKDDFIQLGIPFFGSDERLGENLSYVAGLALGDGCICNDNLTLTMHPVEEEQILKEVASILNVEKKPYTDTSPQSHYKDSTLRLGTSTTGRVTCGVKKLLKHLSEYVILDGGSENKLLTNQGLLLNKKCLSALLRGLFTADGTVANYDNKSQYVSLDLCSYGLLQQVQLLLLQYGIKSKLYQNRRALPLSGPMGAMLPDGKGGQKWYPVQQMHSLRISRSSRILFEQEIGFDSKSPKALALHLLNENKNTYKDFLVDPVASVELVSTEDVYDLTEPATSHFVANGIVVHNCSEFMSIDNSSCNLASINLMKFRTHDGFDYNLFNAVCFLGTVALDILICDASYPTPLIAQNVQKYRQVGLGYANLGAFVMSRGLPYDSDEARHLAAGITACMTASSWLASVEMARVLGPFDEFEKNKDGMESVLAAHLTQAANRSLTDCLKSPGYHVAHSLFLQVFDGMKQCGIRNSYLTNLAPTGTIGLLLGCDTTGIEPELALVKYKKLVGGGFEKFVNQTIPIALEELGFNKSAVTSACAYILEHGTIAGWGESFIDRGEFHKVFATSIDPKNIIHWSGHIKMMVAVQPFLSGAISKTVNMPADATIEDVELAYKMAWRSGLKSIAIYRDGCKGSQPLNLSDNTGGSSATKIMTPQVGRTKLPTDRPSTTHKFAIGGHEGYITVGMYEDGRPGEVFITVSKEGSFVGGLLDSFATMISIALQYGAPIRLIVDKLKGHSYEPQGITDNPSIRFAKSLSDYIGRFLELRFMNQKGDTKKEGDESMGTILSMHTPPCPECGGLTAQSGSCHVCQSCGTTTGCS
jgi:ribonucleoside-diphosphate reductase alpha chain